MRYIQQLDSLRAIAIFFVLCNHSMPSTSWLYKASNMVSGPDIFFTMSGFLITALLLKDRNAFEEQRLSKQAAFKNFFTKRVFRIFPAYYLAVAFDYLVQHGYSGPYRPYWTFTTNFNVYQQQEWGRLAHLWTMAVEQQFYLLWPLVILLTPRRILPWVIVCFIGIGLYSQQVVPATEFRFVLPQTCCDALGLGALLAWVLTCKPLVFNQVYRGLRVVAAGSVCFMAFVELTGTAMPFLTHRTLVALVVVWLIAYFSIPKSEASGTMAWIFNNRLLILIGKMSYGIFLYHLTVMYEAYHLFAQVNKYMPFYSMLDNPHGFLIAECVGLTLLLAWISWQWIELPLYRFSKYLLTMPMPKQQPILHAVLSPATSSAQPTLSDVHPASLILETSGART